MSLRASEPEAQAFLSPWARKGGEKEQDEDYDQEEDQEQDHD
jgi:hypothetical protein